jgi:hypothetical protein
MKGGMDTMSASDPKRTLTVNKVHGWGFHPVAWLMACAFLLLAACSDQPTTPRPLASAHQSGNISYADASEQAAFKAALDRAAIPYKLEMRGGLEMVSWEGKYDAQVEKVKTELFGADISSKSNIQFGDPKVQQAFAEWLGKRGVKYEIVRSRGKDHVVWEGPRNLGDEFIESLGSKCRQTDTRANTKAKPCG